MKERTLSTKELNRSVLARQLLLERSGLPISRVLEQVGGLQTQYAPSGYVGLWSRKREFVRSSLTEALEKRTVVQATLMRVTIHMVSARDYPLLTAGIRNGRREWWLKYERNKYQQSDMNKIARILRKQLAKGPRRRGELVEALNAEGFPPRAWLGAGLWLDMLRAPPLGTWERRRADLYVLAEDWLEMPAVTEEEGLKLIIRRYLGGFGPAPVREIANWAGLPVSRLRPVIERMSLRSFRDEQGGKLVDLNRAPLPDADTPAPVRFLPHWDATVPRNLRKSLTSLAVRFLLHRRQFQAWRC